MKSCIKYISIIVIALVLSYFMGTYFVSNSLTIENKDKDYCIKTKGIKDAVCFDINDDGKIIIAQKKKVSELNENGTINTLFTINDDNIISMIVNGKNIFVVKGNSLVVYNTDDKVMKNLIDDIPIRGQSDECRMMKYGDGVLLSIGAVTNSGVVDDRQVAFGMTIYDRTPIDLYSLGTLFGKDETGAFCEYGKHYDKDAIIKKELPANACIISVDKNGKSEIFASGIKKVEGITQDKEGKVYVAVEGMKEQGIRPVANDSDYIYEVDKGEWLGWPDFSGGDPVTSPKFRVKDEKVNFILDKHITENPKAPLYQYGNPGNIKCLQYVTSESYGKDGMLFYDSSKEEILFCNNNIVPVSEMNLGGKCNINCIKESKDKIYMMDENKGVIYCIINMIVNNNSNKMILLYYALGIIVIGIFYDVISCKKRA